MPKPFLSKTPALQSAFLLASALLLSGCSLLSKDRNSPSAAGPASFTLEVQAPKDVRELLQEHMELQRYRQLSDLRRSELGRLLGAADANIRSLLGTMGYFSPSIELQLVDTPDDPDTPLKVLVKVEPGTPTTIAQASVDFSGTNADDPKGLNMREGIRRNWALPEGAQFTQSAWSNAKNDGIRRLQNRRYPTASLTESRADIDTDTQQAQLTVTYEPGPAYYFGPLVIEGAQRYNPSGLIRLARLPVGDEYRQTTLLDTQQRLANSGYYDSVFLTLATEVAQPGDTEVHAPVIAQVREAKLQKWVYGLGVSTDTGFRFSVDHTHNRVPYLDWRAQSKLQLDKKNPLLSTRITSLPDYSGWNYFVGGKAAREELADYTANSVSLVAGRGKSEDKIDRGYYLTWPRPRAKGHHRQARPSRSTMAGRAATSTTRPAPRAATAWAGKWARVAPSPPSANPLAAWLHVGCT